MGSLFESKTKTTQNPFETNPWAPQQGYLKVGLRGATDAKNTALSSENRVKDYVANMSQGQKDSIRDGMGFARNFAGKTGNTIDVGAGQVDNLTQFGANANSLYDRVGENRTGQIMSDAGRLAEDPYLTGQIDSAINDVNRGFQQDVGAINSGAVATGNINSTRAGVAESLARDDAMDRAGAISSQMRGAAYDRGLVLASDNIQRGFEGQAGANGQLSAAAQQGVDFMSTGYGQGQGALQDRAAGFAQFQAQNQAEIDGLRAKGATEQDIMAKYMATIGGQMGQKGYTTTSETQPSMFQQLVGGATSVMGGIGALKGA